MHFISTANRSLKSASQKRNDIVNRKFKMFGTRVISYMTFMVLNGGCVLKNGKLWIVSYQNRKKQGTSIRK